MNQTFSLRSAPIVDPRGRSRVAPIDLANRPTSLDAARLLLVDNGKLGPAFGNFQAIFDTLQATLARQLGALHADQVTHDLLVLDRPSLARLAANLAGQGYTGAVVALCDSGVTQPSILFAAELERNGVPTVAVCLDSMRDLAAATAGGVVPGLPLVAFAATRASLADVVAEKTRRVVPEIVRGLTAPAGDLVASFRATYEAGAAGLEARDGELVLDVEQAITPAARDDASPGAEVDPAGFAEVWYERLTEAHLTDGFPIIPPTRARVDRMLRFTDRPPEHAILEQVAPSGAALTVEKLAVAAVMAGCRPEYFPILVSAVEAMADERFRLFQAIITSHPSGTAVVVSGPLAREVGIHAGGGCLGPGFRANATIGRAITLCLLNVSRSIPGKSDLATFGSPAEFSYCFAESLDQTPWTPLHAELYGPDTTTVTVHRCEAPHNVIEHLSTTAEGILTTLASVAATRGGNNAYIPAELLVLLNPEHAEIIADSDWSKQDVKQFMFEHARNAASSLEGRGLTPTRPVWMRSLDPVPVVPSAEDILVFVAGTAGPHSMVGIPWGYARAVTRPVTLRDGRPLRSVEELRSR